MKKYLIIASAALVALAACNKEIEIQDPVIDNNDVVLTFTSQKPGFNADTKTAWDATTSSIVWQSTDKIKVGFTFNDAWWAQSAAYNTENPSPNNHIKFYLSDEVSIDSESDNVGTFVVPTGNSKFTGPETSGAFVFYSVYPGALVDNSLDTAPSATVTLKTSQSPATNSFDASTDIMVGTSEVITSTGLPSDPIELKWKRVVAHAALTFSNMDFNGTETPTKVTLTFNEEAKVAGSFSVNISDGTIGTGSANEIVLEGSGLVVDGSSITTWATVLPVSFSSLNVEIKTNKATYTRSITGLDKTFKKNARNTLKINMSTANRQASTEYEWVKKDLSAITSSDVFVIVGNNGSNYAMSNGNGTGSAPSAVSVTVANNKLSAAPGDNIQWTLSVEGSNYTFYPNGTTATWLYVYNNNNGLRVGTSSDNVFIIKDNYIYNSAQGRYIGVYNSSDWRSYTSINNNIKDQTFAFYVRTEGGSSTPTNYAVTWTDPTETDCSIAATVNSTAIASGDEFATGTVVTITATAGTDYEFGGWNVTGATPTDASAATTTFTIGTSAVSISATFNSTAASATALPFEESFYENIGTFTIDNVNIGSLSYVWAYNSSHYMKASSYVSGNNAAESWLVSPLLELPSLSTGETIKFKFAQIINAYFGTVSDEATVWVKEEGESWTKKTITYPTISSGNWSSWDNQEIDLSSYAGKNVQVAFKYVGTTEHCGTWEIKDVSVKKYEPLAHSITVNGEASPLTVELNGDATKTTKLTIASNYTWSVKSTTGLTTAYTYVIDSETQITVTPAADNTTGATKTGIGTMVLTDGTVDFTISFDQANKVVQTAAYTVISTVDDLEAGDYIMAANNQNLFEDSNTFYVWDGSIVSSNTQRLSTFSASWDSATSDFDDITDAATVTLEDSGTANVYYIKVGNKYLSASAKVFSLVDDPFAWTFETVAANDKEGIRFYNTSGNTYVSCNATSGAIRTYNSNTTYKGIYFFKSN